IPPAALSSRRITGSLSRGSVKRGSVMTFLHISRRFASSRNGETHQVWRRFRNKRGEAREPRDSGHSHGQPPGGPKNKKETRKEHGQTRSRRPLLHGSTNKVGRHHADQDEYNVIHQQSHRDRQNQTPGRAGSAPVTLEAPTPRVGESKKSGIPPPPATVR